MTRRAKPNWEKWRAIPTATVWEAVALSMDIDPDEVRVLGAGWKGWARFNESREFKDRVESVCRTIGQSGGLDATAISMSERTNSGVNVAQFVCWARSLKWKIPKELDAFESAQLRQLGSFQPAAGPHKGGRWPWGNYETELLRHLEAAAKRFWANYDVSKPETAVTNAQVIEWLKKQGVAQRTAEVIASILRDTNVKRGPRR